MPKKIATKTFSFGGCTFSSTSPEWKNVTTSTPILNVQITFEEALKLSIAIDECVRKLNSYKRNTKTGRSMGLNLAVHVGTKRITINEEKVLP